MTGEYWFGCASSAAVTAPSGSLAGVPSPMSGPPKRSAVALRSWPGVGDRGGPVAGLQHPRQPRFLGDEGLAPFKDEHRRGGRQRVNQGACPAAGEGVRRAAEVVAPPPRRLPAAAGGEQEIPAEAGRGGEGLARRRREHLARRRGALGVEVKQLGVSAAVEEDQQPRAARVFDGRDEVDRRAEVEHRAVAHLELLGGGLADEAQL